MRILLLVFLLTQLSQTSHAGDGHDESSFLHQTVYKFGQLSEKARLLNDSAIQSCNPKNLDLQKIVLFLQLWNSNCRNLSSGQSIEDFGPHNFGKRKRMNF